jgi:hypothetical protein
MRILCDRHHADLLYSLQLLFEDRLDMELFVPVGHDDPDKGWWGEGYWRFGEVWGDDRLARQFLAVNHYWREVEPGLFLTFDQCHPERPLYGCTLEWARAHSWDYVLATVQENQAGFHRFAKSESAVYLYQIGNARQSVNWELAPLILDASQAGLEGNVIQIAQEFDHYKTFRYREPVCQNRITSFVNLLSKMPDCWRPFEELRLLLPYEFRSYGHECPDGFLTPVAAIAEEMARTGWAYHDKPTGDGFGHIIHNWAAVGRPLIGHGRFYSGQRAEVFWQDGITCIDLDKHSVAEAAEIISSLSEEKHRQMCRAMRDALLASYNPSGDEDAIRAHSSFKR